MGLSFWLIVPLRFQDLEIGSKNFDATSPATVAFETDRIFGLADRPLMATEKPMFFKFLRRHFAKLAGLSALGLTATPVKPADGDGKPAAERHAPAPCLKDFVWIEGTVNEDGRGRSISDTFAHTPGKIEDGSNADRATITIPATRKTSAENRKSGERYSAAGLDVKFHLPARLDAASSGIPIPRLEITLQVIVAAQAHLRSHEIRRPKLAVFNNGT